MPNYTWIVAVIASILVLVGVTGLKLRDRTAEVNSLNRQLAESIAFSEAAAKTNAAFANELETALSKIEKLDAQVRDATNAQQEMENQMRTELESKDITISELQGRLTVNILDRVLFDSGEAQLKPEGEAILRKIADVLVQFPKRQVHIVGHTDNVPIRSMTRAGFASNWELSAGRATAAVRFLHEKAGVDPHRLAAVGYGEFHPIADNASSDGRARNRRIGIVVLPEEIAPSDIPKTDPVLPLKGVDK